MVLKEKMKQNGGGFPEFSISQQQRNYYGTNGKHFGVFIALGIINYKNKLYYII